MRWKKEEVLKRLPDDGKAHWFIVNLRPGGTAWNPRGVAPADLVYGPGRFEYARFSDGAVELVKIG